LGAGLSREQALARGLAEVMERDAISCAELSASHFGAAVLARVAQAFGRDESHILKRFRDNVDLAPGIDPASLPPQAAALYERYRQAGLTVQIKRIPTDLGLVVFGAAAIEQTSFDNYLAAAGYGADLDPEKALLAALLELAQSRATDRQGAREDCLSEEKVRVTRFPTDHWLASPGSRFEPFRGEPARWTEQFSPPGEYLARLRQAGLSEAAAVELDTYPGLSVVRVMVPEIETWHPTGGCSRLGRRAAARFG
jgi:ribosomal protein S12 methylthiotransferase accessory factor